MGLDFTTVTHRPPSLADNHHTGLLGSFSCLLWNLTDSLCKLLYLWLTEVEFSLKARTCFHLNLLYPLGLFQVKLDKLQFGLGSLFHTAFCWVLFDFLQHFRVPSSLPTHTGLCCPAWNPISREARQTPHLRPKEIFYQEGLSEPLVFHRNGRLIFSKLGETHWSSFSQ